MSLELIYDNEFMKTFHIKNQNIDTIFTLYFEKHDNEFYMSSYPNHRKIHINDFCLKFYVQNSTADISKKGFVFNDITITGSELKTYF